jgi:hypothetical protein
MKKSRFLRKGQAISLIANKVNYQNSSTLARIFKKKPDTHLQTGIVTPLKKAKKS